MSKGLQAILQRIKDNPANRVLVTRFLALLAETEDSSFKYRSLLGLAAAIRATNPVDSIRIAFIVHQRAPHELVALEIMIEALRDMGRLAKAEVIQSHLEKLRRPAKGAEPPRSEDARNIVSIIAGIANSPDGGPAQASIFQEEDLSRLAGGMAELKALYDVRPEMDRSELMLQASLPLARERPPPSPPPQEAELASPEALEPFIPDELFVNPLAKLDFDVAQDASNLPWRLAALNETKTPPLATATDPQAPKFGLSIGASVPPFESAAVFFQEGVPTADLPQTPRPRRHQVPSLAPADDGTGPTADGSLSPKTNAVLVLSPEIEIGAGSALGRVEGDFQFGDLAARPKPPPDEVPPRDHDASSEATQARFAPRTRPERARPMAVGGEAQNPSHERFGEEDLASRHEVTIVSPQPSAKARPRTVSQPPGDPSAESWTGDDDFWDRLVASFDPEGLRYRQLETGRRARNELTRRVVQVAETHAMALPTDVAERIAAALHLCTDSRHEPGHSSLTLALWAGIDRRGVLALLDAAALQANAAAFWGFYLDGLLKGRRARRALFEVRRTLDRASTLEWIQAACERLPAIWRALHLRGFDWRKEDGVAAFLARLERREEMLLSHLVIRSQRL